MSIHMISLKKGDNSCCPSEIKQTRLSKEKSQNVNIMSDNSLTKYVSIKIVQFKQLLLIKTVLVNN